MAKWDAVLNWLMMVPMVVPSERDSKTRDAHVTEIMVKCESWDIACDNCSDEARVLDMTGHRLESLSCVVHVSHETKKAQDFAVDLRECVEDQVDDLQCWSESDEMHAAATKIIDSCGCAANKSAGPLALEVVTFQPVPFSFHKIESWRNWKKYQVLRQ